MSANNQSFIYGGIINLMGGALGYTKLKPAPTEHIQIDGVINVVDSIYDTAEIQINGVPLSTGGPAAPGEPPNSVQFNNAGFFGGHESFKFSPNLISLGDTLGTTFEIQGGQFNNRLYISTLDADSTSDIRVFTGDAVSASGDVRILTGDSQNTDTGDITIETGSTPSGDDSGDIDIETGLAFDNSGDINVTTGNSTEGSTGTIVFETGRSNLELSGAIEFTTGDGDVSGDIVFTTGSADNVGGAILFQTGDGDEGGEIEIATGQGSSAAGDIVIRTGSGTSGKIEQRGETLQLTSVVGGTQQRIQWPVTTTPTNGHVLQVTDFNAYPSVTSLDWVQPVLTQVVVKQVSDFPAPVGNVINLAADTQYFIQGDVDIGINQLDFFGDNVSIRGVEKRITFLRSQAASMFKTTSDSSITIKEITLVQENLAGNMGTITIGTNSRFTINNCNFISTGGGLLGDTGGALELIGCLFRDCPYVHTNVGINILNFENTAFSDQVYGQDLIQFESGTQSSIIEFENCFLITFGGGTALTAVTPDLLLNASITQTTYTGTGTLFSGMSQASNTWNMRNNFSIPESNTGGSISLSAPAGVELPIAVQDTFYDIDETGLTWVDNGDFEKFSLTDVTNGEITYNGSKDIRVSFGGFITMERSSTGNQSMNVTISKNGTPLVCSQVIVGMSNTQQRAATIPLCSTIVSTNDTIKMQIKNITDTDNVDIFYAGLTIQ